MHTRNDVNFVFAVARIGLVKPDKAKGVENMVLQMAQRGQITEKVWYHSVPQPFSVLQVCVLKEDMLSEQSGFSVQAQLKKSCLQISESRLIGLLEQVNEQSSTRTKVTIQRRRALDDDY